MCGYTYVKCDTVTGLVALLTNVPRLTPFIINTHITHSSVHNTYTRNGRNNGPSLINQLIDHNLFLISNY